MKRKIFITLLLGSSFLFFGIKNSIGKETDHPKDSHKTSSEINNASVGPKMAVLEASRDKGFKLSEAAWKRLDIQISSLTSESFWIPSSALVYYQDQLGVFRFREGWFRLVPIKILSQSPEKVQIASGELQKEDAVATHGIGFLRVAEMEVFGEASAGHVH